MKRLLPTLLILLILPAFSKAQDTEETLWRILIEEWAERNDSEGVPDDIIEGLQDIIDNPINLNDTTSNRLCELPFITDLQRDIIKAYIAQNGQMVTMAELQFMNGFDTLETRLLALFTTVSPVNGNRFPSLKEILHRGRSNLRIGAKTLMPRSRAYDEGKYQGSPFREYFRYKFHYSDRLTFQLSGDKDAGEPFRFAAARDNAAALGFDSYGYHLMVNDLGIVRSAIVGKYQLQFGQGATLWSGYAPWGGADMPLRRYGQGIRAASAFSEYGYLHGAAATLSLIPKRLEATLFYSFVRRDATADTSDDGTVTYTSLYNTGYHRTENEMAKKQRLGEHLAGAHIQLRHSSLAVGATAFGTFLSDELQPQDYVYNAFAFRGQQLFNAGLDASWRSRRTVFFGEVATSMEQASYMPTDSPLPLAAVAGIQTDFNSDNALSVAYRYGSASYHNFFANTIGQSTSPQNETGIVANLKARLPLGIRLSASVDMFRYPWMRYRLYAPSDGADYRLRLVKPLTTNTQLVFQYQYRTCDRNSDLQTYAVESTVRRRLSLHLDYNSGGWHLLSRVVSTRFDCLDHSPEHGFLLMQDIGRSMLLHGNTMSVAARAAIFDISAYDARIYVYESDMMYELGSLMLMNRGMRGYIVVRYDLTKELSLSLKYAATYYPEQETVGSGHDMTEGSSRHELKAQLRLRF